MSDLYRPALASLPLLLWKTPPGLELILGQEGIAYETVADAHPFAFRRGRYVLFDGKRTPPAELRSLLTHDHVMINIDRLRASAECDPFEALIDHQQARVCWRYRRWSLSERVSRYGKGWIRRRLIAGLREQVQSAGGVWLRLASFPHPYRSAFNFRVDLDEPLPEDYHRFGLTRNLLADCCTHFVSTHAYAEEREILDDLRRYDTQSHGHYHYIYRDHEANLRNLERADRLLREAGFEPRGFAAPHGRWNPGLDDALESLGYDYSSDFQLGYDDFPFHPWKGDRFSKVLQIPIHPVCEGLFLDQGIQDSRIVSEYLARVVAAKAARGEPALVYGHPERRLGRMPEILVAMHRLLNHQPLVWRTTLTDLARWWRWRAGRKFVVLPRDSQSFEVQFEEWDTEYPLALELHRGDFVSALPVNGPRQVVRTSNLAYERREQQDDPILAAPSLDHHQPTLRDALRSALDWETVTPLEEIRGSSLTVRLKKGLRWWKLQQTGTD